MENDIYNSVGRIEARKKNLEPFNNGKCAIEFLDKMLLMRLSPIRVASIAFHVLSILRIKDDIEVKKWTKEDVGSVMREFQKKDWKSETRERFVFVLKRFVSYAKQEIIVEKKNDQDYNPEVAWLHPKKYRIKNDDSMFENRKGFSETEILEILSVVQEISVNCAQVSNSYSKNSFNSFLSSSIIFCNGISGSLLSLVSPVSRYLSNSVTIFFGKN